MCFDGNKFRFKIFKFYVIELKKYNCMHAPAMQQKCN